MPTSLHRCPNPACQYEANPQDSQYCEACGNALPSRQSASELSSIPPFASTDKVPTQATELDFAHGSGRESPDTSLDPELRESQYAEPVSLSISSLSVSQSPESASPPITSGSDFSATVYLNNHTQPAAPSPVHATQNQPATPAPSVVPHPTQPLQLASKPSSPQPARLLWQSSVRGIHVEFEKLEYLIDRSPMTIGYFKPDSGPVDIAIDLIPGWEQTSPQHAQLDWDGKQWIIQDLGSQSGTFRRSSQNRVWERLEVATPLLDHDQVSIGPLILIFQMAHEACD